ncbi:MAG: namA [Nevskia sp.]|jgi:2,4-dienoyl-CoA reductase-like NADH-dependent reductase (Old Yellow Enzyme family)|nr:namA [Nevskia sp.]
MSALFSPARLGKLDASNRIVVAPMCQYSAMDGIVQPWHEQHLGHLANSGAGILTMEATAVEPNGAITHGCLGLWNDEQALALQQMIERLRSFAELPIGIQLAHAGRKASAHAPWNGGQPLSAAEGAWQTFAPSPIAWGNGWPLPSALDESGIARIVQAFVQAAVRADRAGLDFVELHSAHGYLMHAFLSPIANQRDDRYGGSLENRLRFPLEVVRAVRAVWPTTKTFGLRINGTDWLEGGWTVEDAIVYGRRLLDAGVDYLSVSSGGARGGIAIKLEPGYQVPFAEAARKALGCPIICAGLIADPQHAEAIVAGGQADFVALARALLDDPRWPVRAARRLSATAELPHQYQLAAPGRWPLAVKAAV